MLKYLNVFGKKSTPEPAQTLLQTTLQSLEQDPENLPIMLSLVKLYINQKNFGLAHRWLEKAINSKDFSPEKHKIGLTPDELFHLDVIKLNTPAAQQAILLTWRQLPYCTFQYWFIKDHNVSSNAPYDWGKTEETRKLYLNGLNDKILDYITKLTHFESLDPETALLAIELYDSLYKGNRTDSHIHSNALPSDIIQLSLAAAPAIEKKLADYLVHLTDADNINIAKNLNYPNQVEGLLEEARRFVERYATYNEKCAQVYLNWHLQADQPWNTPSAEKLQALTEKFPSLLPAIYQHLDFRKSDIEIIEDSETIDVAREIELWKLKQHQHGDVLIIKSTNAQGPWVTVHGRNKKGEWTSQSRKLDNFRWSVGCEFEEITERLRHLNTRLMFFMQVNDLIDHRNFYLTEELVDLVKLYYLAPNDTLDFFNHTYDSFKFLRWTSDFALRVLRHSNGLPFYARFDLTFLASINVEICRFIIANPSSIEMSHQFLKAVVKHISKLNVEEIKILLEHLNQEKYNWSTSWIKSLINISVMHPTLLFVIKSKLISSILRFTPQEIKELLTYNPAFFPECLQEILCKIDLTTDDTLVTDFVNLILDNKDKINIVEIAKKNSVLLHRLLRISRAYGSLPLETQVQIAKINLEAAEHYFVLFENGAFSDSISNAQVASWLKEIGFAQSALLFKCGMLCLDLLEEDIAIELLSSIPKGNPNFERARYECGNIQFCLKQNKEAAAIFLTDMSAGSYYYHPALIESTKLCQSASITDIYVKTAVVNEKTVEVAELSFQLDDPTSLHQLFGCPADKEVAAIALHEIEANLPPPNPSSSHGKDQTKTLEEAKISFINDRGRYSILRDYVCNQENKNSDLSQGLLKYFGGSFFVKDNCLPEQREISKRDAKKPRLSYS